MADEVTQHFGLPLPRPENMLEYDVFALRDAISGIDSALHQSALNLEQRAQALDELIQQRAQEIANAITDVAHGGTGASAADSARNNLGVPSKTGSGASGSWNISVTGSAGSVTWLNVQNRPKTLAGYEIGDAMPKAGGDFEGQVNTATNVGSVTQAAGSKFQVMGSANAAAMMSFHRAGAYAINFGLDTDNVVRLGGWSQSGVARWSVDASGNLLSQGNVTAYSDERLKTDWQGVRKDFIERLANILHGTYTRIDTGERQAGVSAQGLRKILSEVVGVGDGGFLSVAYGNAALVASCQLAMRCVELSARVSKLEAGNA